MNSQRAVEILKELWRYEKTDKYSTSEIREAIEYSIHAIGQYEASLTKCKDCEEHPVQLLCGIRCGYNENGICMHDTKAPLVKHNCIFGDDGK